MDVVLVFVLDIELEIDGDGVGVSELVLVCVGVGVAVAVFVVVLESDTVVDGVLEFVCVPELDPVGVWVGEFADVEGVGDSVPEPVGEFDGVGDAVNENILVDGRKLLTLRSIPLSPFEPSAVRPVPPIPPSISIGEEVIDGTQ